MKIFTLPIRLLVCVKLPTTAGQCLTFHASMLQQADYAVDIP